MNIDKTYMCNLLCVFTRSGKNYIQYRDIIAAGIPVESATTKGKLDSQFLRHLTFLIENDHISNGTPGIHTLRSLGIRLDNIEESYVDGVDLCLTRSGIRLADALSAPVPHPDSTSFFDKKINNSCVSAMN